MAEAGFRKSEWLIILIGLLLLVLAAWLYFSGGFLSEGVGEKGARVGVLAESAGTVRRELLGVSGFTTIDKSAPLFNEDTIVTGSDSAACLELDDGSTIELGASAMVRLSFESEFSLAGINRVPKVEVVAGQVTGRAKNRTLRIRSGEKTVSIPKNEVQTLAPPVWKRTVVERPKTTAPEPPPAPPSRPPRHPRLKSPPIRSLW